MLIPGLQKNIDERWDDCWPISSLRPLAILDLMSYIFFIKKLDDRELINKKVPGIEGDDFIYTRDVDEFGWSKLKNMDAQGMHDLFTGEHGIISLMTLYAQSNSLYSDFFKAPLILTPTPKLLSKVIEIINIIESNDTNTQAAIIDYLFDKANIAGENGQAFIPENIAWLMVAIAEPGAGDITCDPSAGNGSLVIHAASYISTRSNSSHKFENSAGMLKGMESDLLQLRIAAMNMLMHGLKNPVVEILDVLPEGPIKLPVKPTLLISNLFLTEAESNMRVEGDTLKSGRSGKEIILLNLILGNMAPGSRAVVIVPEYILNNIAPEIKKIRQDIINNYNLEGVVYLPTKGNSAFSRAGILIFNKHESITSKDVWFCKMKSSLENKTGGQSLSDRVQNDFLPASELYAVNDILNQWNNRDEIQLNQYENSFYITAYDIKDNDYNLNFNDYKIIRENRELNKKAGTDDGKKNPVVANKKGHMHHFFEDSVAVQKKRPRRKILTVLIPLLILVSGATGAYFFYTNKGTSMFGDSHKLTDSSSNVNIGKTFGQPIAETSADKPAVNRKDVIKASAKNTKLNLATGHGGTSKGYTVITKAYFYSEPDSNKRRTLFLQPRKDLVLNPINEQNGFEYVVYVNKKGETTKGWLNQKDLQPVE